MSAEHLGGYVAGGDAATFYPDLWRWLVEERGVRSVLDVGCADGVAVRYFRELIRQQPGYTIAPRSNGVDGVAQQDEGISLHDFTEGAYGLEEAAYDLVWCCEFVEHVEERYVVNFVSTFLLAPLVLLTHAEPGQGGHHHVNCRPAAYWVAVMATAGFSLDHALTAETRKLASMNPSPWNHYARSGLAFVR